MKQNQHQAGEKSSRAAQSKQARKTAGQTLPTAPVETSEEPMADWEKSLALESHARQSSIRGGISSSIDPDVPGLHACDWSDGALLDFVGCAFYDCEPVMAAQYHWFENLPDAARLVVRRVRVRGMRPQETKEVEQWRLSAPGLQSEEILDDVNLLSLVTTELYHKRQEVVREVLPKLSLDRALALADALVVAETNEMRNGTETDEPGEDRLTPVQRIAEALHQQWQAQRGGVTVPKVSAEIVRWSKGGAR